MPQRLRLRSLSLSLLLAATHAAAAASPTTGDSPPPTAGTGPTPPGPAAAAPAGGGWINFGAAPPALGAATPSNTPWGRTVLDFIAPAPLDQGRVIFNSRWRYEGASQTGLQHGNAFTLRTRVGYETPQFHGFYGLGEFENTWSMNYSEYASFPPPFNAGRAVIADPRNNQLNQLYLGYRGFRSEFKGGRQVMNLDNQRFVGAVDWRQNDQTYDAVRVTTEAVRDLWFSYAWNWQVNRVFGNYAPTTTLRRFDSNNHFANVHYDGMKDYGTPAAYFYYLDLDGATAARVTSPGTQPLSSTTAGLYFDGRRKLDADWALLYRAEYAFQTQNGASGPGSFWENYYHVIFGGAYQKVEAGAAFENLGGDGTRGFQTPLATLHKFNGWTDQFLTTPAAGLRDYYLWARATAPLNVNLTAELHYFTAVNSGRTYGREFDLGASRKFGRNVTAQVKFAYYWGNGAPSTGLAANVTKVWVQVEFGL